MKLSGPDAESQQEFKLFSHLGRDAPASESGEPRRGRRCPLGGPGLPSRRCRRCRVRPLRAPAGDDGQAPLARAHVLDHVLARPEGEPPHQRARAGSRAKPARRGRGARRAPADPSRWDRRSRTERTSETCGWAKCSDQRAAGGAALPGTPLGTERAGSGFQVTPTPCEVGSASAKWSNWCRICIQDS